MFSKKDILVLLTIVVISLAIAIPISYVVCSGFEHLMYCL